MKLQRVIPTLTLAAACALGTTSVSVASAKTASDVPTASSENWSGYVVAGSQSNNANEKFKSVTSSWTIPTVKSSAASGQTYSAFWVGLGGTGQTDHLEQDGTEANVVNGKATYYAWYELVPKAPVKVDLTVKAGDKITATTAVDGDQVTETIDNDTTGQTFSKTLTMSDPDTSSAEVIAEAPSQCTSVSTGDCTALPLSDFGKVNFTSTSVTNAGGHTGSISDASWSDEAVTLDPDSSQTGFMSYDTAGQSSSGGATPSTLTSDGASFSVSYSADSSGESGSGGYGSSSGEGYGYGSSGGYGSSTGGYGGTGYGYGSTGGEGYGYGSTGGYGYGGGSDGYGYGASGDGYGDSGYGGSGYGVLYQTSGGSWVYVS